MELNAAQQEFVDLVGRSGDLPRFDPNLGRDLRAELNVELNAIVPEGAETVWVDKRALAGVDGCQTRWLAERAERFKWSPALAQGAVSHKAIELSVHWPAPITPLELVDEAVARLEHDEQSISEFLQTCSPVERAELRARAGERITTFTDCVPPIKAAWRPVTEGRIRQDMAGSRVTLAGKPDLTLGRAAGAAAGKVIIDLKSGAAAPDHQADLRFYALLDAMKHGTPPRLLVSYYLDQGRPVAEPVSEVMLHQQISRVTRAVETMVGLREKRQEPTLVTGPPCRWCLRRRECETGLAYLSHIDEDERP